MQDLAQTTLELDHVIVCVPDIDECADRFERVSGLKSVEGGKHAGHGTVNRIVPLNETYLEEGGPGIRQVGSAPLVVVC